MLCRVLWLVASGCDQISRSGGSRGKKTLIKSTSPVQAEGSLKTALCLFPLADVVMAYRKVCDAQAGPLVAEALHCSAGLDLDWDLDKEEPEEQEAATSMEREQMQRVVECQRSGMNFLLTAKVRSLPRIQ